MTMPGRMIQMLTGLADIQKGRREMDLKEAEYETNKQQFAQSLGLQEKSAEYKKVSDLVDAIARSSSEARQAFVELAPTLGIKSDQVQALAHLATNAPETLASLQGTAATAGYRGATQDQRGTMNQEAASQAVTGMNQGAVQQSGLIAQLAGGARGQVTPGMTQAYAERASSNRSPLQALIDATIERDPDMKQRMAGIQAGTMMSEQATGQQAVGMGGVQAEFAGVRQRAQAEEMNIAKDFALGKAQGAVTSQTLNETFNVLTGKLKILDDPKAGDAVKIQAIAEYNALVTRMGLPDLLWNDQHKPTTNGVLMRLWQSIHSDVPNPPQQQPQAPFMQSPQPPSFNNSLQPFVRPPQ
jgi:hypothetical protein